MISFLNPKDSVERQNQKLIEITTALMRRVEQDTDNSGLAYTQFERAAMLEDQVRQRTLDLERTLDLLHDSNTRLAQASAETDQARGDLTDAIEAVSEGFALFSPQDLLVLSNSRFCQQMTDVSDKLHPGLSFADYVRMISRSSFLALPDQMTPDMWAARRIGRHRDDAVMFNVRLTKDRWLQVSEHRTRNGGTVVLQTDITDIMRMEREERSKLIDQQARMIRATLDHLDQGVCIFDRQGRLAGWNRRVGKLLSLPASKFRLGAGFGMLLDGLAGGIRFSDATMQQRLLDWVAQSSGRPALSFEIKSGSTRILDVLCQEMPDHGFVISFTDVTAEREAARALFEANEMLEQRVLERTLELEDALSAAERANASKSRFVAAASHDLLQPLSAAKLYVASLGGPNADEADKQILSKVESALVSVEEIIDALLNISRLDSGKATFDVEPVPLMDVLGPLTSEMEPLAAAKGLDFRVVPTFAVVETDAAFLRRILRNLISNAIRYTRTGRVLVGGRRQGASIRLEVWDTGPGIADSDQDVIFQEFSRLDARASASEGMGLGLAIVERACAKLGHPLGLRSELGRGTGFFVSVPRADGLGRHHVAPQGIARDRRLAQTGLMVLLVENDAEFRRALCLLMERWGISVLDVGDAASAIDLLEEIQITPDAMLVDYQLGDGLNGLELVQTLRHKHGRVPVAILSANRSASLRHACEQADVPLMTKPVDPDQLEAFMTKAAEALD